MEETSVPASAGETLLDTAQVAEYLRCTRWTVRRYVREELMLAPTKQLGNRYLWSRRRFMAWLESPEGKGVRRAS